MDIRDHLDHRLFLRQLSAARRLYHVPSRRPAGLPDLSPEPSPTPTSSDGPEQEDAKTTKE